MYHPVVMSAIEFARKYHRGQKDDCGEDYFQAHIVPVAKLVEMVTNDYKMIAVAFLHDTIEDTEATYEIVQDVFGTAIADMVMELTHEGQKDEYGYFFPRLQSKECVVIKFADRLSNLSRMEAWDEDRQAHYVSKSHFWKDGKDR